MVELILRLPHRRPDSIVTGQSLGASGEHDISIDSSSDTGGGCLVDCLLLPARGYFQRQPVKEADLETRLPARQKANIGAGGLSMSAACCGGKARATAENIQVNYNEPTEAIPMIKVKGSRTSISSSSGKYMGEEGNAAMNIAQLPVCGAGIEDQGVKMTTKCRQEDYANSSFTDTSLSIARDVVVVSPEDWLDVANDFSLPLIAAELNDASFGSS